MFAWDALEMKLFEIITECFLLTLVELEQFWEPFLPHFRHC